MGVTIVLGRQWALIIYSLAGQSDSAILYLWACVGSLVCIHISRSAQKNQGSHHHTRHASTHLSSPALNLCLMYSMGVRWRCSSRWCIECCAMYATRRLWWRHTSPTPGIGLISPIKSRCGEIAEFFRRNKQKLPRPINKSISKAPQIKLLVSHKVQNPFRYFKPLFSTFLLA